MSEIKLSKRNLITSVLVLVIIVFVWQIYELFWEDSLPQDMPKVSQMPVVAAKASTTTILPTTAGTVAPTLTTVGTPPPPSSVVSDDSTPANSAAVPGGSSADVDPNSDAQSEYLRLVNQYQMAQLQRMIAEDNEAIAIAKKNAAQALSETTKLAGDGSVPLSATSDDNNNGDPGYELVYTGQQTDGSWAATLKKDGQTFDVAVGKPLPDGSQVISVDENGVLISQNNGALKKLITFSGEVTLGVPGAASSDTSTMPTTNNPMIDQTGIVKSNPPAVGAANAPSVDRSDSPNATAPTSTDTTTNSTIQDKSSSVDIAKPAVVSAQATQKVPGASNNMSALAYSAPTSVAPTAKAPVQVAVNNPSSSNSSDTSAFSRMGDIMQGNQPQPVKSSAAIAAAISTNPAKVDNSTQVIATTAPIPNKSLVAVSTDPAPSQVVHPVAATQAPVAKTPAPTPVLTTAVAKAPVDSYGTAEKNIMAANPRNYTIQLTSDHQLDSVVDFIHRHNLEGKSTYFHAYTRHGGKLYVLVQGEYPSQEAAQQAVAALPASVRQEGAFVQSYAALQGMVHKPDLTNAG